VVAPLAVSVLGIFAKDQHRSRVRFLETLQHLDGGGLTRSVLTEQTEDFSLVDGETHVVDRYESTEFFGEVVDIDDSVQSDTSRSN
jgi:hypothetical protein